jgi:hypothetical protein
LLQSDDGQLTLRVDDNPWGVVGLASQADSLEPQLCQDKWLLMVYSPHNIQHVRLVYGASEIARQLNGECRLAIRPSVGFSDLGGWLQDKDLVENPLAIGVPLWLIYHNGALIGQIGGQLPPETVVKYARLYLNHPGYNTVSNADSS